jgi:hypothetical protein
MGVFGSRVGRQMFVGYFVSLVVLRVVCWWIAIAADLEVSVMHDRIILGTRMWGFNVVPIFLDSYGSRKELFV